MATDPLVPIFTDKYLNYIKSLNLDPEAWYQFSCFLKVTKDGLFVDSSQICELNSSIPLSYKPKRRRR